MSDAPRPSLTVDRIVDAAIVLANRDGLGAVSMRAVARELGSGVMSLYRHVENHHDLIAHMADRIAGDYPYDTADVTTWRQALERLAWQDWRSYLDHPWLVQVVGTSRPPLTPKTIENYEWAIGWMARTGLPPIEQHRIVMVVVSWTIGMAVIATVDRREAERSGISTDEWWVQQRETIEHLGPNLAPHLRDLLGTTGSDEHEEFFTFGLTALLDGVEAGLGMPPSRTSSS